MDIHVKKLKKNAWRVTKRRGVGAVRVRVPGGHLPAAHLATLQHIAEQYGDGTLHMTTRQGFEIPGIDFKHQAAVNALLQPVIAGLGVKQETAGGGYSASGTRNVAACIGNAVCPFGNVDTAALARRIEQHIFPNDLHVKVAVTGCPNDCIKARMHDFGVIGMTEPQYNPDRCVSCGACVKACKKKSVEALSAVNYRVKRDARRCIGCGECVINCPTGAWTRSKEKYYRLTIMGRTGKKNPRLGEDFILWADEDSILKIILNTYDYVRAFIDPGAPGGKEHVGYIVDRTGFAVFREWALRDVKLNPLAVVAPSVYWGGVHYRAF